LTDAGMGRSRTCGRGTYLPAYFSFLRSRLRTGCFDSAFMGYLLAQLFLFIDADGFHDFRMKISIYEMRKDGMRKADRVEIKKFD
jgi:hypothetical protein